MFKYARRTSALVGGTALALSGVGMAGATAQSSTALSADDESAVRAELTQFQVDAATQDQLIEKLEAGESWDAFGDTTAAETEELTVDGETWNVSRFDDGSYVAASVSGTGQGVDGEVSTNAIGENISDCTAGTGAGRFPYFNCYIEITTATYGMSFMADLTTDSGTSIGASIDRVWQGEYWAIAGTVSSDGQTPPVRIIRETEDTAPAQAEITFLWASTANVAGSTVRGDLYVQGLDAWAE